MNNWCIRRPALVQKVLGIRITEEIDGSEKRRGQLETVTNIQSAKPDFIKRWRTGIF